VHAKHFHLNNCNTVVRIPPFPFPILKIAIPNCSEQGFLIAKNEKRNLFQNCFLLFKEFKVKIEFGFSFFKRLENDWPFHQFMICPVLFSGIFFKIEKRKHEIDDSFSFFRVSKNEWPLDTRIFTVSKLIIVGIIQTELSDSHCTHIFH
jgi:hypothetical protein